MVWLVVINIINIISLIVIFERIDTICENQVKVYNDLFKRINDSKNEIIYLFNNYIDKLDEKKRK